MGRGRGAVRTRRGRGAASSGTTVASRSGARSRSKSTTRSTTDVSNNDTATTAVNGKSSAVPSSGSSRSQSKTTPKKNSPQKRSGSRSTKPKAKTPRRTPVKNQNKATTTKKQVQQQPSTGHEEVMILDDSMDLCFGQSKGAKSRSRSSSVKKPVTNTKTPKRTGSTKTTAIKNGKQSNFYQVTQISDSSDDDQIDGTDSVSVFDKMFANIGSRIGHQRVITKEPKTPPPLELLSSSDDEKFKKSKPKPISAAEQERIDYLARTDKELEELFRTPTRAPKKTFVPQPCTDDDIIEIPDEQSEIGSDLAPSPIILPYYIRVRYRGDLVVFKLKETDICFDIRRNLAQKLNLNPEELLICYEDDEEKSFKDTITLKEAGIKVGTILEAFKIDRPANSKKKIRDPLAIRIKLQSHQRRSEAFYEIRKTDTFRKLQMLYCTKMQLEPSQVKFKFDGDIVDLDETPKDLDLEGDEVFDVFIT